MSSTALGERIGYCPYCGGTLKTENNPDPPYGLQVLCVCRNTVVRESAIRQYGLRRAWEIETKLAKPYTT